MSIRKQFTLTLLITLLAVVVAQAQNLTAPARGGKTAQPAIEDVQIVIQSQQVRIAARSSVVEMQLQIFDQAGAVVYDSGLLTGSELSWALQNANGEAVPSGLYAYSLSVREANAETPTLRRGHMIVERGRDRDPQTDRLWVTSQGPVGAEASLSGGEMTVSSNPETNVVGARIGRNLASKGSATVNLSGFGTAGQIPKFGGGDFLVNSVITEDFNGRIGIGTQTPSSMLTVAGQIETTSGGIKFPNGTVQMTSAAGALFQVSHNATLSGNGTGDSPLGVGVPLNLVSSSTTFTTAVDVTGGLGTAIVARGANAVGNDDGGDGISGRGGKGSGPNGVGGTGVRGIGGDSTTSPGFGMTAQGGNSVNNTAGAGLDARGGNSTNGVGGIGIVAFGGSGPQGKGLAGAFANGNIFVTDSGRGLILRAPNATCYLITVVNGGSLTSTAVTCP